MLKVRDLRDSGGGRCHSTLVVHHYCKLSTRGELIGMLFDMPFTRHQNARSLLSLSHLAESADQVPNVHLQIPPQTSFCPLGTVNFNPTSVLSSSYFSLTTPHPAMFETFITYF